MIEVYNIENRIVGYMQLDTARDIFRLSSNDLNELHSNKRLNISGNRYIVAAQLKGQ